MAGKYRSVKWEITSFIVALLLLVISILSFFILNAQKKSLTNEVKLRGLSIAGNLANNMADFILTDDELGTAKIIMETMNNKGVEYALVADKNGQIIFHNDMELIGSKYKAPEVLSELESKIKKNKIIMFRGEKGKAIDFAVPAIAKGKLNLGTVHLGVSYSLVEDVINNAYINVMIISIIAIVLGIVGAFVLGIAITKPIKILAKGAKIIGTGNLGHNIEIKSKNELGALANIFNMMTRDLKSAQDMAIKQQRMEKELEVAKEIQLSLIPKDIAEIKGYDVAAFYESAKEVGGDYYDVLPLSPEKYGIIMGDVSGKGVPAALIMTMARSILHSEADCDLESNETLKKLNTNIYDDMKEGMFITVFYGVLDIENNILDGASAGHNNTLIYRSKDKSVDMSNPKGFAIGMDPGQKFNKIVKNEKLKLESKDVVVVFTDGITEAMNEKKEEYDEPRLIEVIKNNGDKSAKEILDEIMNSVNDFVKGFEQSDDIAIIVIKKQ